MKNLLKSRNLEIFDLLCDRARELIFISLEEDCSLFFYVNELNEELLDMTPIEQIFYVASGLYATKHETKDCKSIDLVPQYEIKANNKTYKADFYVETQVIDNEEFYLKNPIIVEVDGLEYHSNKKQVNHDYQRENELKLMGYNIIRFTGSQVFNDPYNCLDILYEYIEKSNKEK